MRAGCKFSRYPLPQSVLIRQLGP